MPKRTYHFFFIALLTLCIPGVSLAADTEQQAEEKNPAYVSLGEPMILNLASDGRRLSFLQLQADVLVVNDDAREVVETHIPAIRHKLILLLSEQKAIDMKTPAKREQQQGGRDAEAQTNRKREHKRPPARTSQTIPPAAKFGTGRPPCSAATRSRAFAPARRARVEKPSNTGIFTTRPAIQLVPSPSRRQPRSAW